MKVPNSQAKSQPNGHVRRRYLARRLEILRAAGREFRVRGFAETGMRDIAAAAALSPANLYNYFRGKHDIVLLSGQFAGSNDRGTGQGSPHKNQRGDKAAHGDRLAFEMRAR